MFFVWIIFYIIIFSIALGIGFTLQHYLAKKSYAEENVKIHIEQLLHYIKENDQKEIKKWSRGLELAMKRWRN